MSADFKSAKEFWDEARDGLGYTSERGYDQATLLHEPNQYKELLHTGRETEYGDYTMEVKFDVGCEDLSHKIALETRPAPIEDYRQTLGERLKEASVTMKEIDPAKRTAEVEPEPPLPWYERRAYGGREADDETERQIDAMQAEHDRERELSNPRGIYSIYESAWLQGFNSELKEHIGKDKDGKFYYATEHSESPEDDLCWRGPHATREEAEQGLSDAYDRWDKRTGDAEQAYEDMQIAQFAYEQEHDMEIER